jgi:hypothetical protein
MKNQGWNVENDGLYICYDVQGRKMAAATRHHPISGKELES